jgi:hypothetical protein
MQKALAENVPTPEKGEVIVTQGRTGQSENVDAPKRGKTNP